MEEASSLPVLEKHGLAGWILMLLQKSKDARKSQEKQLRLVETLRLGGKSQVMLVECAGESFLIGGGPESVQTIVRLQQGDSRSFAVKSVDAPCR